MSKCRNVDSQRITLEFDGAPLEEVFEAIQTAVNSRVMVDWPLLEACAVEKDSTITIHMTNVTIADALDAIIRIAGEGECRLGYELIPVIVVAPRERLPVHPPEMRTTEYNDEGNDIGVMNRITPTPAPAGDSGVYVPKDLEDCFREMNRMLHPLMIERMKSDPEEEMIRYHFGLGLWMRNNWGLWSGSRLAEYFEQQGVRHPDDMSGIILDSYWRRLNGQDIRLQEQIDHYAKNWRSMREHPDEDGGDQEFEEELEADDDIDEGGL